VGFKPGAEWRGNASGRPRKSEEQIKFERRCREWADTLGFDKLKRWADCDDAAKSLEALKEIFNRGFGRAIETNIVDAEITTQTGSSIEDIARELAALIDPGKGERVEDIRADKVDPGK